MNNENQQRGMEYLVAELEIESFELNSLTLVYKLIC